VIGPFHGSRAACRRATSREVRTAFSNFRVGVSPHSGDGDAVDDLVAINIGTLRSFFERRIIGTRALCRFVSASFASTLWLSLPPILEWLDDGFKRFFAAGIRGEFLRSPQSSGPPRTRGFDDGPSACPDRFQMGLSVRGHIVRALILPSVPRSQPAGHEESRGNPSRCRRTGFVGLIKDARHFTHFNLTLTRWPCHRGQRLCDGL